MLLIKQLEFDQHVLSHFGEFGSSQLSASQNESLKVKFYHQKMIDHSQP